MMINTWYGKIIRIPLAIGCAVICSFFAILIIFALALLSDWGR